MKKLLRRLREKWKYSKLRFYIANAKWNYSFWIKCRRKYINISYIKINPISGRRDKIIKKRFDGYEYKGKTYEDNPGMTINSRKEWIEWRKKGLIKR